MIFVTAACDIITLLTFDGEQLVVATTTIGCEFDGFELPLMMVVSGELFWSMAKFIFCKRPVVVDIV